MCTSWSSCPTGSCHRLKQVHAFLGHLKFMPVNSRVPVFFIHLFSSSKINKGNCRCGRKYSTQKLENGQALRDVRSDNTLSSLFQERRNVTLSPSKNRLQLCVTLYDILLQMSARCLFSLQKAEVTAEMSYCHVTLTPRMGFGLKAARTRLHEWHGGKEQETAGSH